jgi:hypothetical protein
MAIAVVEAVVDSFHTPSREDDDDDSDNVNETADLIVPLPLAAGTSQSMTMQKYSCQLITTGLALLSIMMILFIPPLSEKIHMMNFNNSDFVVDFTRALQPVDATYLSTNWPPPDGIFIVPFILNNGTLLCPPNLKEIHSINQLTRERSKLLIDMIHTALLNSRPWHGRLRMQGLPFLALIADQNGCNVSERFDAFDYPRFSWSLPATKYGDDWCNTISVPSYSNWLSFHNENQSSLDSKRASNWKEYAWSSKKNKAVWRGSTTCPPSFMGAELNETPRGKLVKMSIKYPHQIDAAFVNFANFFKDKKEKLRNETNVAIKRMPFEEQMAYKAIIDIDGNNWSSRFASLLCTNSVVIKVRALNVVSIILYTFICFVIFGYILKGCFRRSTQIILKTFTMN